MRRVSTDDEGHYHFGHLNPGIYFVCVSAQPWYAEHNVRHRVKQQNQDGQESGEQPIEADANLDVVYPVTFFASGTELAGATPITLRSGDNAIADFRMRPVPALHVLLRTTPGDREQNPNVQVTQTLTDDSTTRIAAGFTPVAPGLLEVTGVPPGRFHLRVNSSVGNESTRRSQSVELTGDAELDLVPSASSAVISGILRMDDASPPPQPARVRLRSSAGGEAFDAPVSATGEFSFKSDLLETGNYELMIMEPQGLFIKTMVSTGAYPGAAFR